MMPTQPAPLEGHQDLMDEVYKHQRYIYDLTR
ncbi:MAG: hypothetical protein ACJAVO_002929, partial [Parvibaculaceae bacterium]